MPVNRKVHDSATLLNREGGSIGATPSGVNADGCSTARFQNDELSRGGSTYFRLKQSIEL